MSATVSQNRSRNRSTRLALFFIYCLFQVGRRESLPVLGVKTCYIQRVGGGNACQTDFGSACLVVDDPSSGYQQLLHPRCTVARGGVRLRALIHHLATCQISNNNADTIDNNHENFEVGYQATAAATTKWTTLTLLTNINNIILTT